MYLSLLAVIVTALAIGRPVASSVLGQGDVEETCVKLVTLMPDAVYTTSSANYTAIANENWCAQPALFNGNLVQITDPARDRSETARASPSCIVQPTSAADVQQIVKLLVNGDVPFAIRSGGHSPSPGAANINDGILIDMAALNKVTYNPESSTATVGTGNTWGTVYTTLDKYNVTVVGGRDLNVGVGGLLLQSK